MACWFVMDRRVASELKKNYFFICCRPPVMGTRQFSPTGKRWQVWDWAGIFSHDQSVASHVFSCLQKRFACHQFVNIGRDNRGRFLDQGLSVALQSLDPLLDVWWKKYDVIRKAVMRWHYRKSETSLCDKYKCDYSLNAFSDQGQRRRKREDV